MSIHFPGQARPFLALALIVLLSACISTPKAPQPSAEARTIRQLPEGELIGFIAPSGAQVWRGLPYAAAPTGELRWRAPGHPGPGKAVAKPSPLAPPVRRSPPPSAARRTT